MKWATNIDFFSDDFGTYPLLLLGNHVPNGYLVRKSIFEKTGYYTEKAPLEDYYIFLQIAKYARMRYIPQTLFYYRWHGTNSIKQLGKMGKFGKITRRYDLELVKKSNDSKIKQYVHDYLSSFPIQHILKIPFVIEIFKRKTSCFEQVVLRLFGFSFELSHKNL